MFVANLILFLIVIGAFLAVRKNVPGSSKLLIGATGCGLVVFAITVWLRIAHSPERLSLNDEEAAGLALGRIIAREVPAGIVLVLRLPTIPGKRDEITGLRCQGLLKALRATPLQVIQAGPNFNIPGSGDDGFVFMDKDQINRDAAEWCAKHPEVKAVASLLPTAPEFSASQIPSLYGFYAGRETPWVEEIKRGQTKAALLYRPRSLPPETNLESNDGLPPKFILVSTANLNQTVKALQL